ncbi:PAS domain S-box protein [Marivirga harenae]|uniref:PAS domain S-box protein n=1 Tax=Marivirga harenae TaxID=2010992 RepID=UPI0026DF0764|nr:PAS domain S-box protein [Marivirga harenae]WKV12424.1 PAS domain S-box protein [Marivirga harenae]
MKKPDYSNFFYFNPLPSLMYDVDDLHILDVNKAAIDHYGYSQKEFLALTIKDLRPPEEVPKLIKALLNTKRVEGNIYIGIFTHIKKDGTLIQMEVNGHKLDFNDRQCMLVVCQDVTEQKQKEQQKELLADISLDFSSASDLFSASNALCKTMCEYGQFDFAELWLPNIENTLVQLIAKTSASPQANNFYKLSDNVRSFRLGEGLPGAVWEKRSTLLWNGINKKSQFSRQKAAEKAGIQTALGIPLRLNDQIVGVLLIGTQNKANYLKKYIQLFEELEHFIGSEINRKRLENELSHLYDAIPDIVSVGDFKGRFLRINQAGCELLGYEEEEILYQSLEKFIYPDDLHKAYKELERLEAGESNFGFDVRFLTKSGELIWLSWCCKANVDEGLIYSSAKNITQEKKLSQLNKQASDLAKVGSWEYDLIEDDLFWSEEVHRLHKTDPNSFNPTIERAIDFYREEHKPFVEDQIYKSINEGVYLDYEAAIISTRNEERWIRVIASPEYIEGKCVKLIGSFQDITDRKEAELGVVRSEEKFRTIFDIATLGIAQVDPLTGKISLANSYYEAITGYTADELMNMSFVELTHPDDREKDWELFSKAAHGEGEYRNEKRYVKKDGTIVWVRLHVAFIRDEKGKPLKTVAICEDITDRKEAESRLQNLSDNIPGVVYQYFIHPAGKDEFKYVSRGAEKIWSYSPEAVTKDLDLVWNQVKDGGDFQAVKKSITDSIDNQSKWSMRYRIIRPDGEKRIIQGLGTPEFFGDGTVVYNSVALDITEEVKNEELLELATDLARIGSWEIDMVHDKLYWSDTVYELHEIDPDSFEHDLQESINFYRKDFRQLVNERITKAIETGKGFDFEAVIITAKKQERWVRVIGNAEFIDGKCQRVYGSFQDIHERKITEAQKNSLLETLENSLNEIYMFEPTSLQFSYVNRGALLNIGYSEREMKSLTPIDLKPEFTEASFVKLVAPLINNEKEKIVFFTNHKRKNGSLYPVEVHLQLVTETNKKTFLAIILDITERRKAEEKLIELNDSLKKYTNELELTNQELEQFAYIASHDLQEPLRMVTSFMDLLKRKYEDQLDDKALQYIGFATDGAKRMKTIILDLLDYSRAGKLNMSQVKVSTKKIVDDYKILRKKAISEKNVRLEVYNLPTVKSYPAPLTQTIHCLLDNAIKYSRKGVRPIIKIDAEELDGFWQFKVEDNGIGIEPKFFEKIFIIFQRLHNRDEFSGSGIGLAIAKKHVESWGGTIRLESTRGEGSTFYFTIPKA